MSTVKATRRSSSWTAALASAACLLAMGAASASDAMETKRVPVTFSETDLSTPAAADNLYGRIQRAARVACGYPDSREILRAREIRACYHNAIESAVGEINNPLLTAIHNARSGAKLAAN